MGFIKYCFVCDDYIIVVDHDINEGDDNDDDDMSADILMVRQMYYNNMIISKCFC